MNESIQMMIDSLNQYGPRHRHWALAWSGGKDSTSLVTMLVWLLETGKVARPESLTICYADTRMELLPLWISACQIREELAERGHVVREVMAPLDKRFWVYILGRGVPPPNNTTLRWCTEQIKIKPMAAALETVAIEHGLGRMVTGKQGQAVYEGFGEEKLLVLTGVRQGESAVRDGRIVASCSKNGSECGQGWYQQSLPTALCDTLAPLLHFRVCHVWEWLKHWAPQPEHGDWSTELLADAYGGDEAEEINARTGCVGCPLAELDSALDAILKLERWRYLCPLKKIRPIHRMLRTPPMRLRKAGGETRKDGSLVANQQRMGPLTFEARRKALAELLAIQDEVNASADKAGRPHVDFLNAIEVARIEEMIASGTWPEKWTGDEPNAAEWLEPFFEDGSSQPFLPLLFSADES